MQGTPTSEATTGIPSTLKGKLDFFGKEYGTMGSSQSGFSFKGSMNKTSRNDGSQAKTVSAGSIGGKKFGVAKKKLK